MGEWVGWVWCGWEGGLEGENGTHLCTIDILVLHPPSPSPVQGPPSIISNQPLAVAMQQPAWSYRRAPRG